MTPKARPVVLVIRDGFGESKEKRGNAIRAARTPVHDRCILADIAPAILEIMGIEKPVEMTGRSILQA